MVDIFSSSSKLCIYVPKFYWRFKYYVLHIARLYFSSSLVFNVQTMSILLYLDNSVSRSAFGMTLAWLFVLKIYSVTYLEGWWFPVLVFCAVLKQFSSNVFLAVAKASLCASRLSSPESGSPSICCMGSRNWCRGKCECLP